MPVTTETSQPQTAGVWQTFNESPTAAKAIFAGVFVNRLGAFLSIFLVLFVASKGHSAAAAAATLGAYGIGGVVGILIGGFTADRLGARISTVFSMSASAALTVSLLYLPNYAGAVRRDRRCRPGQPDLPAGLGHPAVRADAGEPAGDDLRDVPVRGEHGHHRLAAARLPAVQPGPQALHPAVLG